MKPEIETKKETARILLDRFRKAGADDVVIEATDEHVSQLKFYNSRITTTQSWMSAKISVFVAIGRKLIATSLKDFSNEAVGDSVSSLMKFASAASPTEEYKGIANGPFTYREIDETYDPKVADLGEKAVDITEGALNAASSNGAKRSAGVFESHVAANYVLTSSNVEASEIGTKLYFSIRSFADREASGHFVCNSRILSKFKPEDAAIKSAEVAKQALSPVSGQPGKYDILFEPLPFSNILYQAGDAFSIFNVESSLSCFAGKLGKQVASPSVTIFDDATLPNSFGASKFDAEGVPTQKNTLIDRGILKTYLHNTSTARRYNTKTTANAGLVSPAPFNIVFENGNFNKEEMFPGIKRGLVITNVWYTRFQNHSTGDFSTIPRDGMFLIENGKVAGPVKELRISGNLISMLQNVAAVGCDSEQVFGWEVEVPVNTPPVVVKGVKVTKSVA